MFNIVLIMIYSNDNVQPSTFPDLSKIAVFTLKELNQPQNQRLHPWKGPGKIEYYSHIGVFTLLQLRWKSDHSPSPTMVSRTTTLVVCG